MAAAQGRKRRYTRGQSVQTVGDRQEQTDAQMDRGLQRQRVYRCRQPRDRYVARATILALTCAGNLEKRIADDPPSPAKLARLTSIWKEVVRLEKGFWDMGLQLA